MTFILNVLHRDFSLIGSDRKATSKGPTTIKMPGITIHSNKGATIHGYKKIYLSKKMKIAVGIAGHVNDHDYIHEIEKIENIKSTFSLIRNHMERFLAQDHKSIVACHSFPQNEGIGTYYIPEANVFFSNIYIFSSIHNSTRLYVGKEDPILIHVGSGSRVFESAVGSEEIRKVLNSARSISDITSLVEWMKQAYREVSSIDKDSGEEMVAFLATKADPFFVDITR